MWGCKLYEKTDTQKKELDELKKFCGIGQTFNYLGRSCLVTRIYNIYNVSIIAGDYADNNGVIRTFAFRHGELPILKAQQKQR